MERFWAERDSNKKTARNEFRDNWDNNVRVAREQYGHLRDGRSRILLLNGPPGARFVPDCPLVLVPVEVWYYPQRQSYQITQEFWVILFRKWGAGWFQIWNTHHGIEAFFAQSILESGAGPTAEAGVSTHSTQGILACRDYDNARMLLAALGWMSQQKLGWSVLEARLDRLPEQPASEWVSTFNSYSTDVAEGIPPLAARLDLAYPGRNQSRTVLQGMVTVPASEAGQAELGGHRSYNFLLNGEVLRDGTLFDSFRYKFDLPSAPPAGQPPGSELPLLFQRALRPGEYTLVVRVEDVNSGKAFRAERPISVPEAPTASLAISEATPAEKESARLLAEAEAALRSTENTIRLVPPQGELRTGMTRFETLSTGAVAAVAFALDGKPVLTKRKPPFSVELDLGSVPRPRTLTALAFDPAGQEIASDEIVVNAAANRFRVRLTEPRKGRKYGQSLLAHAEVETPEGEHVERVEIFLNEARVATLYQPPYTQPIVLPREEIAYVRAVAFLTDGNSTEHLVFVNAPENLLEVDVDLVELYTTVLDRRERPVFGLTREDFTVFEDGARQDILRFETVTDLPIHAVVALDVSASMEKHLEQAQQAALRFFQETIRPRDRAALVLFNDHPQLAVKLTRDVGALAGGLAGIKAERGTSLWDTIVFSLFYFNGVKGQRAMLLLSDGKDEGSRFTWEEALDFARRAGVTIYTIGLGEEVDRKKMEKLSEETGGRAFFLREAAGLDAIYRTIEEELRSKYLIAYQSGNSEGGDDFRAIEVKVAKPGADAKTLRGYYP